MRVGSEHEEGGDMGCEWTVNMRGWGYGCEWTVNMRGVGIWGASRQ